MTPTERLYEIADAEGIAVEFHTLPYPLLGFYFADPKATPVITLAPEMNNNQPLLRCVFAEELGHHCTSAGDWICWPYRSHLRKVLLTKVETRALKWAARVLMPINRMLTVFCRGASAEELADYFGVTCAFVRACFTLPEYVRIMSVTRQAADDIWIG